MEDAPVKRSVAELAGKFKGHVLPMPTSLDERKPVRRRPPCSLKLHSNKDDDGEKDKKAFVDSHPPKVKMKNSLLIERLQANLALSPTSLLPKAKPPEVKQQPVPLSPISLCTSSLQPPSQSPTQSPTLLPVQHSSDEEEPASFERPPESTPLPCFNKGRARLSFKRRPPTRQHRRSKGSGDEGGASWSSLSPCELHSPQENGDEEVFESPGQEPERAGGRNSPPRQSTLDEAEEEMGTDSAETEYWAPTQNAASTSKGWEELANKSPPPGEDSGEPSEGETEAPECMEAIGEDGRPSMSYSPEPVGGSDHTEFGSAQEADGGEN